MTTGTTTRITQIGTVIIPVTDQDRALEFYVGTLGLEKRGDVPFGDGERWVDVAPAGASTTMALATPRMGLTPGTDTRVLLLTEDIDVEHARLRACGVDVDPEVMRMGDPVPPMFFFRDPDDNNLALVEQG